jgi:hypothetical protein
MLKHPNPKLTIQADAFIWKLTMDSFIVESLASFFVCSVCVMHWAEPDHPTDDWTIQFLPPLSWAFIMLSIHDQEGWFPDTSSFMTLIQWALGSYTRWEQPLIRIAGQLSGMAMCIAMLCVQGKKLNSSPKPLRLSLLCAHLGSVYKLNSIFGNILVGSMKQEQTLAT